MFRYSKATQDLVSEPKGYLPESAYCITCKNSFFRDALCSHLWWCSTNQEFLGGGDASAGCASKDCKGCQNYWHPKGTSK